MECLICMDTITNGKVICCNKEVCIQCILKQKLDSCPFCRSDLYTYNIGKEYIDIKNLKEAIIKISNDDDNIIIEEEISKFECIQCKEEYTEEYNLHNINKCGICINTHLFELEKFMMSNLQSKQKELTDVNKNIIVGCSLDEDLNIKIFINNKFNLPSFGY